MMTFAIWSLATERGPGEAVPRSVAALVCLTWDDGVRWLDGLSSRWAIAHGHGYPPLTATAHPRAAVDNPA